MVTLAKLCFFEKSFEDEYGFICFGPVAVGVGDESLVTSAYVYWPLAGALIFAPSYYT